MQVRPYIGQQQLRGIPQRNLPISVDIYYPDLHIYLSIDCTIFIPICFCEMQMYVYSVYVYYTQELMFSFRIWIQQIFQAFYQIFARTATTENVGEEKSSIFLWKGLKKVRQNRSRILRKDSDHDRLKLKLSATLELPKKHRSEIDSVKYIIGHFLQEEVQVMK